MCGEKAVGLDHQVDILGSPPRMQGKGPAGQILVVSVGITPACAGKSAVREILLIVSRDHPRVCGEKSPRGHCLCYPIGSPPRMRGKERNRISGLPQAGITPAYAGKSSFLASHRSACWDHPRVCGEKALVFRPFLTYWGSPPRMRGKDHGLQHIAPDAGITPAHAGKS